MLRARLETLILATYGGLAAFAGRMRARVNDKLRSPVARRRFWEGVLDGPIAELALAATSRRPRRRSPKRSIAQRKAAKARRSAKSILSARVRATPTC